MNIDEINWHDSVILRVIEDANDDTLTFEVNYPVDWENCRYEPRNIVFTDVLNYEVHEGPFFGSPTILEVHLAEHDERRSALRIETNAGFRKLLFKEVQVQQDNTTRP